MTLKEMLALLKPSGLLGPDLTEAQVLEAVGLTVLGADHAKITEWVQVISENPSQLRLLFHEFTETLARTAFFKYKDDHSSPQELKAHELCQASWIFAHNRSCIVHKRKIILCAPQLLSPLHSIAPAAHPYV